MEKAAPGMTPGPPVSPHSLSGRDCWSPKGDMRAGSISLTRLVTVNL